MKFLPSFFSKEPHIGQQFLALDIGSSTVKVALFGIVEQRAILRSLAKEPIGEGVQRNPELSEVIEAVKKAVLRTYEDAEVKPKESIIGLSGERTIGTTTVIRLTRAKAETPIDEKELSLVQDKSDAVAREQTVNALGADFSEDPLELVSSKITAAYIDGQKMEELLGQGGKVVEVYSYAGFSTASHLAQLQEVTKKVGLSFITATPLLYAVVEVLNNSSTEEIDAIIVDVGAETTDVAVVIGGGIVASRSLSIGNGSLVRALANERAVSETEAQEVIHQYTDGSLSADEVGELKEVLKPVIKIWVSGLGMLFSDMSVVKKFPGRLLFLGGGSTVPDYKELLLSTPWTQELSFEHYPKMRLLGAEDIGYSINDDQAIGLDERACLCLGYVGKQIGG